MSARPGEPLLDALRAALSKDSRIHAWQIRKTTRSALQSYLVRTDVESERTVGGETHEVTVFVRREDLLGQASVTLLAGEEGNVASRLDEAVYFAGLGGNPPWELPKAVEVPRVRAFDAALAGENARATSRRLADEWREAAGSAEGARPSSAEIFCASEWTTLENSTGLVARWDATRVSLLSILLASDGAREAERVSWEERRRASDLDVGEIVRRAGEEARDLTRAALAPSGEYPVVIDAGEMWSLFGPLRQNASAESLYRKVSRFEAGKPLPIEGTGGEPLTLVSNAVTPYGLSSYAFDGDGTPGRRVEIVKDGVFTKPWATKQFADYLGTESTGAFANLEIPPGKTPLAELLAAEGPVLHVKEFSWLSPDPGRGSFGSEIRVGYLHEKGTRRPVKGGAVSGGLFRSLGSARFAREAVMTGGYLGAAAVRLEGLTVAGA